MFWLILCHYSSCCGQKRGRKISQRKIESVPEFCSTVAAYIASSVSSEVSVKVFIFLSVWRNSSNPMTMASSIFFIVLVIASLIKQVTFFLVSSLATRKKPSNSLISSKLWVCWTQSLTHSLLFRKKYKQKAHFVSFNIKLLWSACVMTSTYEQMVWASFVYSPELFLAEQSFVTVIL